MSQSVLTNSTTQVKTQVSLLERCKNLILAMQHLIAMFGATVLVPILTGLDSSVALFSAGLGTLIFHLCTKGKVPVFLGSSFAFIPVILTVKSNYNGDLTYAQGGIVVAGALYVAVSLLIQKIGVDKIKKYLPSQVVGPMIIVIGLNLVPVAFDMASSNFLVSGITLCTALLITWKGTGFIKQLAILIAVITGYILASALGIVNTQTLTNSPWFAMPNFTLPKFELGAVMIIAPVVLAVFMEHVGDITTNGRVVGKNFIEDPGLNRTLLGDGLATLAAGFIGGPANTTYGENTGVLAITKNYNPAILRVTALLAITLGLVAKIGGFLGTIPASVMGGISIMLFSMISLIGVKTIKNNNVKFTASNITVMSVMLFLGLGSGVIEKYFGFTLGIPVTDTIKITGLSFAALVGVILNSLLNRKTI